jgi:integrase
MPKKAKELKPVQVRRLVKPGTHAVGGVAGLLLQVSDEGARSWIFRYSTGERLLSKQGAEYFRRRDIGLGGFPDTTLEQARDRAREVREQLRQGIDPIQHKRENRAALMAASGKSMTFAQCAAKFIRSKSAEFKNAKHTAQWVSTLNTYASPVIGRLPVDLVTLPHIVKILEPIWITKTETAARLRGRIERVLAWATVSGFRSGDNPARWSGNLDAILPQPGKLRTVQHHKAVTLDDIATFYADLKTREGMGARALKFILLTAARSGEVRGATWGEIDLDKNLWTVPAERMKAKREHIVPLCSDAVKLLKSLPRLNELVFPAARGGVLSDMSISATMRRMNSEATPHGMRSTFRDWCAENTNYPREVAEMALAHTIANKVEAAYRRGDLLAKRTKLMNDWCKFLNMPKQSADVTPIRGARA